MIAEGKDQGPQYCLSFSPNWNTYQILSINNNGLLAYGSNAESFLIDISNKNFISSVKPSENIPNTQLKVTSMLLDENFLFVGFSNGLFYAFNHKLQNQVVFKEKASSNQIMHIAKRDNFTDSLHLLLVDSEGLVYELVYIQGIVKIFPFNINCQSQIVKVCQYYYQPLKKTLLVTVGQKGIVSVWNLEEKSQIFTYNTANPIYKADCIVEDEDTLTCGLIGKKDVLNLLRIDIRELFANKEESQKSQVYTVKLQFQIQPKDKGDSEVLTAKPHIMFLNKNKVLISGKTGELFIVSLQTIETRQELDLKHLSAIGDEEPLFEVVERNPHYKQIYSMEKYINKGVTMLVTLGIDRRLCFWKYEDDPMDDVEHLWSINFLGSKIKRIATSPLEKNKLFMTCLDKTIRIWDLEKKNNKFSTQEIWKQLSHTQIINLTMHPDIEGICAYTTDDAKICMFDLASQVCWKVVKMEKGIRSIQWVHKDVQAHFINFANAKIQIAPVKPGQEEMKEEGEDAKINVKHGFPKTSDPKFTKVLSEDYVLMTFLQDNCLMFLGVNEGIEFYSAQTLVNQDSFDYIPIQASEKEKFTLIATGAKDGKCSFWKATNEKAELIASFKYNNMHISSVRFNRTSDNSIFCATSSHDRKIIIYEITVDTSTASLPGVKIRQRLCFKHKNKVDQVKWSIGTSILALSYQDRTIQVWDCALTEEDRNSNEEFLPATQNREVCNIRGHDGYVTDATFSLYDEKILITASDDQTVKVWNIDKILHKSLANPKKKNKKKKNKHKGGPLEEEPNTQKKFKLDSNSPEGSKEEEDQAHEAEGGQEAV